MEKSKNYIEISKEIFNEAGFESENLVVIVENGEIRIVEEDAEFCCGYFLIEEDKVEEEVEERERQLLSMKGTIYLPVSLRKSLNFNLRDILELVEVDEGLLIKKVRL